MKAEPDTIKVSATHRAEIQAAGVVLNATVKSALAAGEETPSGKMKEVSRLVDELAHFGLPAHAVQVQAAPDGLRIRCENPERIPALFSLLGTWKNVAIEGITWQYPDEIARETARAQALSKADESARKV